MSRRACGNRRRSSATSSVFASVNGRKSIRSRACYLCGIAIMKEIMIQYRSIEYGECEKIREMDASQYIGRAWRSVEGVLRLVEIGYLDPDFPEGYDNHLRRLLETVESGGIALGAFDSGGHLIGFSALNLAPLGEHGQYVLLDQLFVSRPFRGKGIGKGLFLRTADEAKKRACRKIYICAGSSEETIAFYRAVGCTDAAEVIPALYEADPRDLQLEYTPQ